jgi:hypothetical protein
VTTLSKWIPNLLSFTLLLLPLCTRALADDYFVANETVALVAGYDSHLMRAENAKDDERRTISNFLYGIRDALKTQSVLKAKIISEAEAADGIRIQHNQNSKSDEEDLASFLMSKGHSHALFADIVDRGNEQFDVQLNSVRLDSYKSAASFREIGGPVLLSVTDRLDTIRKASEADVREYLNKFPNFKSNRVMYVTCFAALGIDKRGDNTTARVAFVDFMNDLHQALTYGLHQLKDGFDEVFNIKGLKTGDVQGKCFNNQRTLTIDDQYDIIISGFVAPSDLDTSGLPLIKAEISVEEVVGGKVHEHRIPFEDGIPNSGEYEDQMKRLRLVRRYVDGFKKNFCSSWKASYGQDPCS